MTVKIYFMINLHESMGPGRDHTQEPPGSAVRLAADCFTGPDTAIQ